MYMEEFLERSKLYKLKQHFIFMKERDVFILVSLFLVSVFMFSNFGNVFTGKAGDVFDGGGECTECGDGTLANSCVDGGAPWYCLGEGDTCTIVTGCSICGCPDNTPHCVEDGGIAGLGACGSAICGDGLCEGDEDSASCCNDCGCDSGTCESNECVISLCGNGAVDSGEECDGSIIGKSCSNFGYDTGSLSCNNCVYVTSGCSNYADDDPSGVTLQNNCASVNGICTDSCLDGYEYYDNINYDRKCEVAYGDGLICCVPDYSSTSSGEDANDMVQESTSIIGVDKFVIGENEENGVQKSAAQLNEYQGVEKILMSPSYAMGGVWIVFILTVFVIGISFYVHGRIFRKK